MIDPEIVRRKYSSMTDEELIDFAEKEKADLTETALEILQTEIQRRRLKSPFSNSDENKKITDPFRILSAAWELAFSQRKKGKSDEEIVHELRETGLSAEQVRTLLIRLPNTDYTNEKFEELIRKNCDSATLVSVFALLFALGVGAYFTFFGISRHFFTGTLLGFLFLGVGIFITQKYKGEFKGGTFWIDLIKTQPDRVVWIKPILEKNTIGFVITLFKVRNFQFLTKDGISIKMTCDSDEEQKIFFEGVRDLLPHAQLGYSPEVAEVYEKGPQDFIITLQRKGIYTPIDSIR